MELWQGESRGEYELLLGMEGFLRPSLDWRDEFGHSPFRAWPRAGDELCPVGLCSEGPFGALVLLALGIHRWAADIVSLRRLVDLHGTMA